MSLELKWDEPVSDGIRRIVCEGIDQAVGTLTRSARTVSDDSVHDARKRFKEIRATLRLVRGDLGEKTFRRENRAIRDAGRPLSVLRDSKAIIDTLDELVAHFAGRVNHRKVAKLRRVLLARRRATRRLVLQKGRATSGILRGVRTARRRVADWPLDHDGWRAIAYGLGRMYRHGRRAMTRARGKRSDGAFHEWRKRTKDLRYALELLHAVWPESMEPLAEQAHRLTDLLGDDHDLVVLRAIARNEMGDNSSSGRELLLALIDERRRALKEDAFEVGLRLYEEDESEFVARIKGYWKATRAESRV